MADQMVIRCESCGEKKAVESSTMSSWLNGDKQFFCDECIKRLKIKANDPNLA